MIEVLPTARCIRPHHQREGGCYACCEECNYYVHACNICNDRVNHDGRQHGGGEHVCRG